jgi:hypothetical protein
MYFVGFLKTCHRDVITEDNNLCLSYHIKHINKLHVCVCVCVCGSNAVFFLTLNLLVHIATAVLQKCYQGDDVFSIPCSCVKSRR